MVKTKFMIVVGVFFILFPLSLELLGIGTAGDSTSSLERLPISPSEIVGVRRAFLLALRKKGSYLYNFKINLNSFSSAFFLVD